MTLRRNKKPCPGCNEPDLYREADKLCRDCQRLLIKARAIEEAEERLDKEKVFVLFSSTYHWNEYIHTRSDFDSADIMKAFTRLASAASVISMTYDGEKSLRILGKGSSFESYIMNKQIAEAIRDLRGMIQDLINKAYESGKRSGHNLLMRLASGDLAPNEYLENTETEES